MKYYLFFLFLLLSSVEANSSQWGPGATTPTCIDWDSDGYGVGAGCTGADGDDADGTVHTAAQIITKHAGGTTASGGLSVFLENVKGYTPTNYYFVATTGSDTTGAVNDPSRPWATVQGLRADHALIAGDIVIIKGGTYTDNWTLEYPATSGAMSNPVIFMAYPGEKPIWDIPGDFGGDPVNGNDFIIFDGLSFTNSTNQSGRTYKFGSDGGETSTGIVIRNSEVWHRSNGVFSFQGINDWIIEKNSFHDTDVGAAPSHSIYLGARSYPNNNIDVSNNLLYNTGLTCAQMNGRVTNYKLHGNVCYNFNNASGFSLEMGVTNSHVYNNIVFGGAREPIVIFNYPPPDQINYPQVLPRDMTGNIIEYNTFVVPSIVYPSGLANNSYANIAFSNVTPTNSENIYSNTVRNNLLINYADGPLLYSLSQQSTYNGCVSATDYINATETHSSFLSNGIDTINLIKQITVSNNLFYDVSNGNIFRLKNSTGDCGSPINAPSPDADTVLGWIAFTSHSPQYTGNVNADPLFTDVFQGYWATPSNNNFSPTSNSPAIGVATPSTVTTDIAGAVRSALSPTLGAIEVGQLGTRYNIKSITKQD